MEFTLNIPDNQKAMALIEFLKTLDFVHLSPKDNASFTLTPAQINILDKASTEETISLAEFRQAFKDKHGIWYPAF